MRHLPKNQYLEEFIVSEKKIHHLPVNSEALSVALLTYTSNHSKTQHLKLLKVVIVSFQYIARCKRSASPHEAIGLFYVVIRFKQSFQTVRLSKCLRRCSYKIPSEEVELDWYESLLYAERYGFVPKLNCNDLECFRWDGKIKFTLSRPTHSP